MDCEIDYELTSSDGLLTVTSIETSSPCFAEVFFDNFPVKSALTSENIAKHLMFQSQHLISCWLLIDGLVKKIKID